MFRVIWSEWKKSSIVSVFAVAAVLLVLAGSMPGENPAPKATEAKKAAEGKVDNPYLKKVDEKIEDQKVRQAIRAVQPACVKLNTASGINLTPEGHILTAAHAAKKVGEKMSVLFPDGNKYPAECSAIDTNLDVAILAVNAKEKLPFATVAKESPEKGTKVVCIGQPGEHKPDGKPTGYQPFCVSTGKIRGFLDDPLGDQTLGRTKHDAWTYWGHSGSPLFNELGQIVAMHNSWDSTTAMRHAVTHQAIVKFLKKEKIAFKTAE